jgi:arginyl-tRNA synthetase
MESIIVHTKNAMELSALKSVLKEMNIKFEKFHTKNTHHNNKTIQKIVDKKNEKITRPSKPKGL